MNFLFNVVVWGDLYTDFFLDVSLKAQLAPGNLPQFTKENQGQNKYIIYTTTADAQRIRGSEIFNKLSSLVPTEFIFIEDLDAYNKDIRRTPVLCNAHAIKLAAENDYRLIFLVPDMIFSDGSLANLLKIAQTGKRVIMLGYFRTLWETFVPVFKKHYPSDQPYISASARELIKLALEHLHPETLSWTWGSPNFRREEPFFMYCPVKDQGMIERSLHLHPIMLYPSRDTKEPEIEGYWSIDGSSYLSKAFPNFNEYYVVQDSDEVFVIDLLQFDERYSNYIKPGEFNYIDLLMWPARNAFDSHLFNYQHKIYFHVGEIDSRWETAEQISDSVAATFEKFREFTKEHPKLFHDIATIYDELKATKEEKKALIHVAATELNNNKLQIVTLLNELGKLHAKHGDINQAINVLTKATEIAPELAEANLNLASIYGQQNDYFKAFKYIQNVIEKNPQNTEAAIIADEIINKQQSCSPSQAKRIDTTKNIGKLKFLIIVPRFIASYGQHYIFPLGLAYISATLKQNGYDVNIINLNHDFSPLNHLLSEYITNNEIDVVCTGGLSIHYKSIKNIIEAVKQVKRNVITIVGGGLVSSEPEIVIADLDVTYGVIGEGEQTIIELAEALTYGSNVHNINGIAYRDSSGTIKLTAERAPIDDLDSMPYPDYDGLGFSDYLKNMIPSDERELAVLDNPRPISLISSRSCPFSCTFCYHPLGKKYRQRSLDSFFAELEHWITSYDVNIVFIMDELFSLQHERIYEFCARIKKLNIKWVVQLTVKGISSEILNTMRDAGCYLISYGLESGSNDVLKSMKKPINVSDITNVLELTYLAGIGVQGNFIFGDIAETTETIIETLDLWLRLQHQHYIYMVPIEVYPGTELYKNAINIGKISDRLKYIEDGCRSLNLTQINDDIYLRSLLLVYILRISFIAISSKLIESVPIAIHPVKGQLYKVKVICPHCEDTIEYSNLSYFDTFMTGCRSCNRRFNIFDTLHKKAIQINSELSTNYSYSEAHIVEMRNFLNPNNLDWLLQTDLDLGKNSSKFMAIKLFDNIYILPQRFSADDIRYCKLQVFIYKDGSLLELANI